MEFVKKQATVGEVGHVDNCHAALAFVQEFHTDPKKGCVSVIFCDDDYDVIGYGNDFNPDTEQWIASVVGIALTLGVAKNQPVHLVVVYDVDKDNPTPVSEDDLKRIQDLRVALWDVRDLGIMDAIAVGRGGLAYTYAGELLFHLDS